MTILESTLVRPIYTELQGIFTEIPHKYTWLTDEDVQPIIDSIEELIGITNNSVYDRYCPVKDKEKHYVSVEIRIKLSALIMRLYGEYFPTEERPFSGKPVISVNQYQTQAQNISAAFAYQINYKIDQAIEQTAKNAKERKFLEKLKKAVQAAKDIGEVAKTIVEIATSLGLSAKIPEYLQRFL